MRTNMVQNLAFVKRLLLRLGRVVVAELLRRLLRVCELLRRQVRGGDGCASAGRSTAPKLLRVRSLDKRGSLARRKRRLAREASADQSINARRGLRTPPWRACGSAA